MSVFKINTHGNEAHSQELQVHAPQIKRVRPPMWIIYMQQWFHHFSLDCAIFLVRNVWSSSVILKTSFVVFICPHVPADILISFQFLNLYTVYCHVIPLIILIFNAGTLELTWLLAKLLIFKFSSTKHHEHLNPLMSLKSQCIYNQDFCLNTLSMRWELWLFLWKNNKPWYSK